MKRSNIKFIENEAFEEKININLFNEIINYLVSTTENNNRDTLQKIKEKCILFKNKARINNLALEEVYYFGELLERYENKIGNSIQNIRAISLAVGYAKDLITDKMIVGTQLIDFINKIKNMADNDIYLKGALYLYDNKNYFRYKDELLNKKYNNTEDIIFILSLFENIQETFENLRDQIVYLTGKNKTISGINNIKTFAWLINNLYKIIKKDRKKDIDILKKLILLPTKKISEGDDIYNILLKNGYQKYEIFYLNYGLLFYVNIPNTVRLGNSITEERIAIDLCKTFLNSNNTHNESIYNLIEKMIEEYRYFDIKCRGNEGLIEALNGEINIINPTTFFKFYNVFQREIFSFDILEEKWDILAETMDKEEYETLFDKYIEDKDIKKEKIEKCIEKYNKITNTSYIDSFYKFDYKRNSVFEFLVNKNIISLENYYKAYEEQREKKDISIQHLKEYVSGIHYRNAFLFLKFIIEDKKCNIEGIDEFGFHLKYLYKKGRCYYYSTETSIDVQKDFLNKEEKEELFYWLDNYMFNVYPNDYIDFIEDILREKNIKEIVPMEQLKEIYFSLIKVNKELAKDSELREIYLNPEELQKIINKEAEERRVKREQELQEKKEEIIEEFNKLVKKNFKELYNFCSM